MLANRKSFFFLQADNIFYSKFVLQALKFNMTFELNMIKLVKLLFYVKNKIFDLFI